MEKYPEAAEFTDKLVDRMIRNPPSMDKIQPGLGRPYANRVFLRALIAARMTEGKSDDDIGEEVGLSSKVIETERKLMTTQWLKPLSEENLDIWRRKELDKLDALEAEYWDAWYRSKADREINAEIDRQSGTKKTQVKSKRRISQVGVAEYLKGIKDCMQRRAELLGLDAATKIEAEVAPEVKRLFDSEAIRKALNVPGVRDLAAQIDEAIADDLQEVRATGKDLLQEAESL